MVEEHFKPKFGREVLRVAKYRLPSEVLKHMLYKAGISAEYNTQIGFPLYIKKEDKDKSVARIESGEECIGNECSVNIVRKKEEGKIFAGLYHTHGQKLPTMSVDDMLDACRSKFSCVGGLDRVRKFKVNCYVPRAECDMAFFRKIEAFRSREDEIKKSRDRVNRKIAKLGIDNEDAMSEVDKYTIENAQFESDKASLIKQIFDMEEVLTEL
jgi:hypothetical protein